MKNLITFLSIGSLLIFFDLVSGNRLTPYPTMWSFLELSLITLFFLIPYLVLLILNGILKLNDSSKPLLYKSITIILTTIAYLLIMTMGFQKFYNEFNERSNKDYLLNENAKAWVGFFHTWNGKAILKEKLFIGNDSTLTRVMNANRFDFLSPLYFYSELESPHEKKTWKYFYINDSTYGSDLDDFEVRPYYKDSMIVDIYRFKPSAPSVKLVKIGEAIIAKRNIINYKNRTRKKINSG
jgi:hypothetical protein